MKQSKPLSVTTRFVILTGLLLPLTNIVLGAVLIFQSVSATSSLVRKNMLSIVCTAADIVNGDRLGSLQESDVGSAIFTEVKEELSAFQNNTDIEYIYAVRQDGPDRFIFTVDADPEDPADFGEEVLVTDALRSAAKGTASIDDAPAQDEWGNFYSTYCPVYDSSGAIAGIIGVDFDSEWYDGQIRKNAISVGIISLVSVAAGILILLYMSSQVQKRVSSVLGELSVLSSDIDRLSQELVSAGTQHHLNQPEPDTKPEQPSDEIEEIGRKVHNMHNMLSSTLEYLEIRANTDALTGTGNRMAFFDLQDQMEEDIHAGKAEFTIIVFDINDLKHINDVYGHEHGDRIIRAAADLICRVFGKETIYRIGGDEFVSVLPHTDMKTVQNGISKLNAQCELYSQSDDPAGLSISAGASCFNPETAHTFREVFNQADQEMYRKKREYHEARRSLQTSVPVEQNDHS